MTPIYKPKGRAAEYGDYALNIFQGCTNGCLYCYAPGVLRTDRSTFNQQAIPRAGIVEATKRQLDSSHMTGETVFLCFSCDPFPYDTDCAVTVEVIKTIKAAGNHVKILTKNPITACDHVCHGILDADDWLGTTFTCNSIEARMLEPNAEDSLSRLSWLCAAKKYGGVHTWVSFEPVVNADDVLAAITTCAMSDVDEVKIGLMNHVGPDSPCMVKIREFTGRPHCRVTRSYPDFDPKEFGIQAEALCKRMGLKYYIKQSLRDAMG